MAILQSRRYQIKGNYQPLDATLTALAGLDTTAGYVRQTGTDVFTKSAAAVQSDQETATSVVNPVVPGVQQFHPSAAKAWCSFSSTAGIGASYNITSVTDNGVGDWTVNIGTDFSSGAYAGVACGGSITGASFLVYNVSTLAAGTFRILALRDTRVLADPTSVDYITFVAFGDQ